MVKVGIIAPMFSFQYHPEILQRYPHIVGGVTLAEGLKNGPTSPELKEVFIAEQQATLARVGNKPLSELAPLAAWRAAFRGFGVNPTKYRSAVEALLRRLTKKGDIPSINILVDICNLLSIRYELPVAAFDIREVNGPITVRFAAGDEFFTPLGAPQAEHPEPGEVIFADERNLVVARRWCWRQSNESASGPATKSAVFTIEAQHEGGRTTIKSALGDLDELLQTYAGGEYKSSILSQDNHAFSW